MLNKHAAGLPSGGVFWAGGELWTNTHLAYSPRLQNSALVVLRETVVISRAALVFADSLMATAAPMSGPDFDWE